MAGDGDRDAAAMLRTETKRLVADMVARSLARKRPTPPLETGLVNDLALVGVNVSSVWDLVATSSRYPEATDILIAWLERVDDEPAGPDRERFREGIIRSLSTLDARPAAAAVMIRQFRTVSDDMVRWAAGNAIGIVADASVFAETVDIVRHRPYGIARQMPVDALPRIGGKSNRDTVIDVLIELLGDDDVVLHAISAVRRIRASRAESALTALLDHERPTVRRRAEKALARVSTRA